MIEFDKILHEKIRSYGEETYKKFLCSEIIQKWDKIVDEKSISDKIKPVMIEHGVLFVNVQNSSLKDQLKFFSEEIIEEINENFAENEPLVKEIRIAKGFQVSEVKNENKLQKNPESTIKIEEIELTDAEIKICKEKSAKISDEKLRQTVLETLKTQIRSKKFKMANGWHKCRNCETLCPPEEIFCEVCRISERNLMIEELFEIFFDKPWTKTHDAQKILLKKLPEMRGECSLDVIESARTSLIQKIASKIRFCNEKSPDVEKLVMLEKRLPPEKLTQAIIQRTLIEMQFNFPESAKFQKFNALNRK